MPANGAGLPLNFPVPNQEASCKTEPERELRYGKAQAAAQTETHKESIIIGAAFVVSKKVIKQVPGFRFYPRGVKEKVPCQYARRKGNTYLNPVFPKRKTPVSEFGNPAAATNMPSTESWLASSIARSRRPGCGNIRDSPE